MSQRKKSMYGLNSCCTFAISIDPREYLDSINYAPHYELIRFVRLKSPESGTGHEYSWMGFRYAGIIEAAKEYCLKFLPTAALNDEVVEIEVYCSHGTCVDCVLQMKRTVTFECINPRLEADKCEC
jgi:hypothetical protein